MSVRKKASSPLESGVEAFSFTIQHVTRYDSECINCEGTTLTQTNRSIGPQRAKFWLKRTYTVGQYISLNTSNLFTDK